MGEISTVMRAHSDPVFAHDKRLFFGSMKFVREHNTTAA